MIAKRFNAKEFTVRLKATIQSSGKLGFTNDTMSMLNLTPECSIYLAPDDSNKKIMYMGVLRERKEDAFPLLSSGKYLYLNTRQLFDALKLDYATNYYIFDISRFEEGDEAMESECYKMTLRSHVRTKEEKEQEQAQDQE